MTFLRAQAVWPRDHNDINQFMGFHAVHSSPNSCPATLRLAAINNYRLYVNGEFTAHGPARTAHGCARIDEITINLIAGNNHFAIEVFAYHMNSFDQTDQVGMLAAELLVENLAVLATGTDFQANTLPYRLRQVQRYSFQRATSEAYRLDPQSHAWRKLGWDQALQLTQVTHYQFLERRAPYPLYPLITAKAISTQQCSFDLKDDYHRDRAQRTTGEGLKGCTVDNLELNVRQILDGCSSIHLNQPCNPQLSEHQSIIYDLSRNRSGFVQVNISCSSPVHILISFDERLDEHGDVNFTRLDCLNAISFELQPGHYELESAEPYTARFIKVHTWHGSCQINSCSMRAYENPTVFNNNLNTEDPLLQDIYHAGLHTLSQNSVDIFTDCPSRERAGWLCDSFFMGRAERLLCGSSSVETDFLENFILPESFANLPSGMLPMCYPADFSDGTFIPQWSLWYVLELQEFHRSNPNNTIVAVAQPRMQALFAYFSKFENDNGLLDSLQSWNFIEWSKANGFTQEVNYPTNMLYCAALEAYAELYHNDSYGLKAQKLRQQIINEAWDGMWFHDHAVCDDDDEQTLRVMDDKTEVCQYYALFFGFKPDGREDLWQRLCIHFGSAYDPDGLYKNVHPANAFIGYVLRIDLLDRHQLSQQCLEEIKSLYGNMARETGTLWEHKDTSASCNHGFAGFIASTLLKLLHK